MFRPRIHNERYGLPDMDMHMRRFEGRRAGLGYLGARRHSRRPERRLKGLRRTMVEADRWVSGDEPTAYSAENTARIDCTDRKVAILQAFRAIGTITGYRPQVDRYRAPRQVPTTYRPSKISSVCRSFILCAIPAVGAVDTLTTFTGTSALCR